MMPSKRRYKFKKFEADLHEAIRKDKKFGLAYEVETAKLKMAEKLAELRERTGWTQAQLAKRMRVSQQLISRIENGAENISLETLIKFFDTLGVCLRIGVAKRRANQEILKFA